MTAIPVEIIRPKRGPGYTFALSLAIYLVLLFAAWLVMLLVGAAHIGWYPGYWQTYFLLLALRIGWPGGSDYLFWSRDAKDVS